MGSDGTVALAPFLHLGPGVVKAQEPVGVQALRPELAVERHDEGIVRGLSRPGEVEVDTFLVCPTVKVLARVAIALWRTDYKTVRPHSQIA